MLKSCFDVTSIWNSSKSIMRFSQGLRCPGMTRMSYEWSCLMWAFLHGCHTPNHSLAFEYLPGLFVTPCPPHLLCVCVSTQGSVLCVRSECVIFSAPPWPYALPFPPSVCFAGGWVGLPFWFVKWVLEILAGRKPHKGLQKPPMREGMVQCRKARFSLCISLFLQVWSHFFTFMWQSKGRLALPF